MITQDLETIRQVSEPFNGTEEELKALFECLEFELKTANGRGVGLSAIQINIPIRACIIRGSFKHNLYNAKIVSRQQKYVFKFEGCLSIPRVTEATTRYNLIEVQNGNGETFKVSGFDAVIIQHEIDHWDGVLFTDRKAL
jgi:peptide deformylase